jgi:tRNA-dihydrouridine synthase B
MTLPSIISPPGMPAAKVSAPSERPLAPPFFIGPVKVDPPILQAPMAGFTNFAFRQIVRELGGAGLLATEMVNARGFAWLDQQQSEPPDRLWGVREEPRPLAVQIWDNDPWMLAQVGARLAHDYRISVVDINFGCPVRQVTQRAQSGSYLLKYPQRVGKIIEQVVAACSPTPVTAKIRLGCTRDQINARDIAQVIEGAGACALTVHGRTAADMFRGSADWDQIAAVQPYLQQIPLIGNGDLDTPQKVVDAFRHYRVDGVMIARAALGKPWLFSQAAAALRGIDPRADPSLQEQRQLLLHNDRLVCRRFGPVKGTILMRKYACCYAQGCRGARQFRKQVATVGTPAEFQAVVERYFPRHLPATARSGRRRR